MRSSFIKNSDIGYENSRGAYKLHLFWHSHTIWVVKILIQGSMGLEPTPSQHQTNQVKCTLQKIFEIHLDSHDNLLS